MSVKSWFVERKEFTKEEYMTVISMFVNATAIGALLVEARAVDFAVYAADEMERLYGHKEVL